HMSLAMRTIGTLTLFLGIALASLTASAGSHAKELKPGSIELRITPEHAKTAVKQALATLNETGDLKSLGKAITELDETGSITTQVSMRGMRKPAKALKSLLEWVDENHDHSAVKKIPFSQFVGALGRLNVAITSGVQPRIKKAAKDAREAFERMKID